jgi:hypothetical protein
LAQEHKKRDALEEAAQCKLNIAALIIGYIALVKPGEDVPIHNDAFK